MKILGVNDGFAGGIALLEEGRPRYNVQEERFNKIKNSGGPPHGCFKWLEVEEGIDLSQVDAVGVPWEAKPFHSIEDYGRSRHYYFDKLLRWLPASWVANDHVIGGALAGLKRERLQLAGLRELFESRRIPMERVKILNHHQCHAAAAYYASGFSGRNGRSLVISLDGSGDGESMSVWSADAAGMKKIGARNSYHSIGILIARVTKYMGMKPHEHEYKMMGMAPYGGGYQAEKAYQIFKDYFKLDESGLYLENCMRAWGEGMVRRLHKDLFQVRFDSVCYAIQRLLEELAIRLVLNWVDHTGIRQVVVGGGVFMNVKLNMILSQHPAIEDFFVLPSCGDESLALGAAYLRQEELKAGSSQPLEHLYLGHQCTQSEIDAALERHRDQIDVEVHDDIEDVTAELLAHDHVIGRCRGRAEWGARALGNRSILCHPARGQNIHRINKAVKMRDFWMPFCPSILDTHAEKYLDNPRHRRAPFMILAFDSLEKAREDIICGLHPFDLTARPQIVEESVNPLYYRLLKKFEARTGIGGVVNTSFNLHGLPMVNDAEDALHVLLNSELDYVTLENRLLCKKGKKKDSA